eukprot:TRINITY_DN12181_c0_g1_i2.p1 TRINITY_DN12181_c0_g1~~TRINITY_DN12181_c0_g1_i2.p1  ORF type:complete len:633 (+),score=123.41 TRINITY_DN12181_c0_g1_i2:637-2535(+)
MKMSAQHTYGTNQDTMILSYSETYAAKQSISMKESKIQMDYDYFCGYHKTFRGKSQDQCDVLWKEGLADSDRYVKENGVDFVLVSQPREFVHEKSMEIVRQLSKLVNTLVDKSDIAACKSKLQALVAGVVNPEQFKAVGGFHFGASGSSGDEPKNDNENADFEGDHEFVDSGSQSSIAGKRRRIGENEEAAKYRINQQNNLRKNELIVECNATREKCGKLRSLIEKFCKFKVYQDLLPIEKDSLPTVELQLKIDDVEETATAQAKLLSATSVDELGAKLDQISNLISGAKMDSQSIEVGIANLKTSAQRIVSEKKVQARSTGQSARAPALASTNPVATKLLEKGLPQWFVKKLFQEAPEGAANTVVGEVYEFAEKMPCPGHELDEVLAVKSNVLEPVTSLFADRISKVVAVLQDATTKDPNKPGGSLTVCPLSADKESKDKYKAITWPKLFDGDAKVIVPQHVTSFGSAWIIVLQSGRFMATMAAVPYMGFPSVLSVVKGQVCVFIVKDAVCKEHATLFEFLTSTHARATTRLFTHGEMSFVKLKEGESVFLPLGRRVCILSIDPDSSAHFITQPLLHEFARDALKKCFPGLAKVTKGHINLQLQLPQCKQFHGYPDFIGEVDASSSGGGSQ